LEGVESAIVHSLVVIITSGMVHGKNKKRCACPNHVITISEHPRFFSGVVDDIPS